MADPAFGRGALVARNATGKSMSLFLAINLVWSAILLAASGRLYFLARALETQQRNARKILMWIEREQRKQRQL